MPWDIDITDEIPRRYDLPKWPGGRWAHRDLSEIVKTTNHHIGSLLGSIEAIKQQGAAYLNKEEGRPAYPYTFIVMRDGTIIKCLDLNEGNWHDHSGKPHLHLCIGADGALHKYPPTDDQLAGMIALNAWAIRHPEMRITYSALDRSNVTGHEDWYPTECPGWSRWASGRWRDRFYATLDAVMGVEAKTLAIGIHDEPGAEAMLDWN